MIYFIQSYLRLDWITFSYRTRIYKDKRKVTNLRGVVGNSILFREILCSTYTLNVLRKVSFFKLCVFDVIYEVP